METQQPPVLRVVWGDPTDEEIAALVGAMITRARPVPSPPPRHSHWLASARPGAVVTGLPATRGRHGWRTSALPR